MGRRSSERERERFVLKLVKKKEVAKRKEVPRDKRKHVRTASQNQSTYDSNRSPNQEQDATTTEAKMQRTITVKRR